MVIDWTSIAIIPIVSAAVGLGVWFFQSRIEKIRRAQEALHEDRRAVYAKILEPFIKAFAGVKDPEMAQEAIKQMASYDYKKIAFEFNLIGADDVVRSFNEMMQWIYEEGEKETPDHRKLMRLWGGLLLAIRRSVNASKTNLSERDMLRGLVKGIDGMLDL